VDHSGVGDGVVVVVDQIFDDLLGLLNIRWTITGNSYTGRGFNVSDLWSKSRETNGGKIKLDMRKLISKFKY